MEKKEDTSELVVVDVKRYKKVKKALAESEERYRQLFENVPIGIYRTTPDGRIIDSNPALVRMLGYGSFAELATRNLEEDFSDAGYERRDFVQQLERDGEVKGLESVWKRKDGSAIHVRENAKLIRSQDGQVFYEGTVEDITQGKLAEEAERRRTQQLEILNCIISKGNTAASLAELLEVILDCIAAPLDFDTAGIFLYDAESQSVRLLARRGKPTDFSLNENYMSIDNLPFSQVLRRGQPLYLDDTRNSHPFFFEKWGWRMAGSVPLVSKGRVVGALNVASCQRRAFSPEEKGILELIGKEAGTLFSKLRTETALRESEKYYRTLIDTSPDVIAVVDFQGKLVMVNQSFLQISGFFYDEVIGHSVLEFVPAVDDAFFREGIRRFLKTQRINRVEYQVRKKDGTVFPLEMALTLLTDETGEPSGIMGVGRDVSERKRAEGQLRNSEEKYRTLFDSAGDAIFIHDAQARMLAVNSLAAERLGYSHDELMSLTIPDVDSLEESKHAPERIARLMELGHLSFETVHRRKDGALVPTEVSARRIAWEGRPAMMSICRDISERKRAEEALRHSEETFRRTFAAIPSPAYMWVRQEDGCILLSQCNLAAETITHGKIRSFLGVEVDALYAGSPDFARKIKQVMRRGKRLSEEVLYRYQSTGESKWLVVDYVRTAPGNVLVITRDVSERKEAETKLLAYQEQLRALSSELVLIEEKERRRIASELHDQIGQNLALCKLKVAALEGDASHEKIRGELSAVRRLLECSIQDARSLIFDLSPPVLYELGFKAALEWLAETIEEQYHVPVELDDRAAGEVLESDRQVILFQVVRELLVNVGKHSRASRAKVILSLEDRLLKIQVNDDGIGFDPAQICEGRGQSGSFGFFSMRERLQYLGGGLEVKSRPGQGTQIVLTVLRVAPANARAKEKP